MHPELDDLLTGLVGLPLWAMTRHGDSLLVHLGERLAAPDDDGGAPAREVGALVLHVACPWRWAAADRVLVGSGDLLTPADAEVELDEFDWEEPGASWLDVRLEELAGALLASPPVVRSAIADAWLGLRVELSDATTLELFPNSTPTGHVTTEFWRIARPGSGEPDVVAGTFGIER